MSRWRACAPITNGSPKRSRRICPLPCSPSSRSMSRWWPSRCRGPPCSLWPAAGCSANGWEPRPRWWRRPLGATLLFLAARTAFGDSLRRRAGPWLRRLQEGFQADAFNYLLFLRLVPLFPFFVVNLVPAVIGVPAPNLRAGDRDRHHPRAPSSSPPSAPAWADLLAGNGEITLGHVLSPLILTALAGLALLALLPVLHRHWRRRQKPQQGQSAGGSK